MIIKLDREYEVKCTLGTIKEIEKVFATPFYALMKNLDKMTTSEQIKLLFVGVKKADSSIGEKDFVESCEDNLGLGELTEYLEQFVLQLQYPGLSKEEIKDKLEKKLKANQKLPRMNGSTGNN